MSTITATPQAAAAARAPALPAAELAHRILLAVLIGAAAALLGYLVFIGYPYYSLSLEERPFSPLHAQLRSSGTIGLRLGFLSLGMFGILFLYPLRKRWRWLGTIGSTRRWLNVHVFFGITTPLVVTLHTGFKWHGLAGLAYWTMVAVALSGFVGRYVYAKIPRGLNAVALTIGEIEAETAALAARLQEQAVFTAADLESLMRTPSAKEVRAMGLFRALGTMLALDVARPFQVSRLRRRVLRPSQRLTTLGGLLASHDAGLEAIVLKLRRQSRLLTATAFLDRSGRIFHLWHVIHRPFSISFMALVVVHITVALSVGVLQTFK